jgi:hypothetical protein
VTILIPLRHQLQSYWRPYGSHDSGGRDTVHNWRAMR